MFLFNAAVMGYGESSWMKIFLDHLDAIAVNVANTSRLQEECFVLTIHLSKVKDSVNLPEFKAVMLAALRSIVPDEWNMDHEMAWNWLWESVERIISSTISFPRAYEKTIRTFLFEQSEANMNQLRAQTYSCFFQRCPSGQDHFKQSTTRLYFILDRNYEMVLEIFENPAKVVEDLSALGLRHVGFGVPVEFFPPFVASAVEALNTLTTDEAISQAFTWSETLISKILMRVILEGSTIVMKAINLNEEAALRKAISVAPRGQRAQQLLNITAGTQSFSPLFWAIDSGSLNSAKAIIQDPERREAKRGPYSVLAQGKWAPQSDGDQVYTACAGACDSPDNLLMTGESCFGSCPKIEVPWSPVAKFFGVKSRDEFQRMIRNAGANLEQYRQFQISQSVIFLYLIMQWMVAFFEWAKATAVVLGLVIFQTRMMSVNEIEMAVMIQ
ncbi:Reverse transcriptase domain-containing protein [Durusdinium trenchii]|uniref:Reverse transcriptase domain-containing protein n=1 Tax=Durusdinium trenchii TaxID=1381693 RepID=A0ABP0JBC1_9DINO